MTNGHLTLFRRVLPLVPCFIPIIFLAQQAPPPCIFPDFVNGDTLYLQAGDDSFSGELTYKGNADSTYYLTATALKDPIGNRIITADKVSVESKIGTQKGQEASTPISVKGNVTPGLYYGTLLLKSTHGSCTKKAIICINTLGAESAVVASVMAPITHTVAGQFLNGILPVKERRTGLAVPLENKGAYPTVIERVLVELIGTNSQEVVRSAVQLKKADMTIHPYQTQMLPVSLAQTHLSPDEYTGKVQIYIKNNKRPLNTSITVYRRCSVLKALFMLLLGIALGSIYFLVKSKKMQTKALQQVLRIKNEIANIGDEVSKKELALMVRSLLYDIEKAESEEETALQNKIQALKTAINDINQLDIIAARILERNDGVFPEPLKDPLNAWRDAILGDPAKKEAAKTAFEQAAMSQGGSRGGASNEVSIFGIRRATTAVEKASPTTSVDKPESRWTQLLTRRVSVLFIYTYLRPLVWLISLLALTLVGLQQIYLNASPSFGAEGLYDYLKLLGWGIFSNIASGSIIDHPLLNKLAPAPAAQSEG